MSAINIFRSGETPMNDHNNNSKRYSIKIKITHDTNTGYISTEVTIKKNGKLLTNALFPYQDITVEEVLLGILNEHFKDIHFILEEEYKEDIKDIKGDNTNE